MRLILVQQLRTALCVVKKSYGRTAEGANAMLPAAPPVATAALRGWSLLLSTLTPHQVRHIDYDSDGEGGSSDGLERRLAALTKPLASSDVGVRRAAGEGAALLYSQSGMAAERDSPTDSGCACFPHCTCCAAAAPVLLLLILPPCVSCSSSVGIGSVRCGAHFHVKDAMMI